MASLGHYLKKYGKREGRKKFNEYYRNYWEANKERLRKYQRDRYRASKQAPK